jgi:uncharacterized protein YigA (DUF484 family)
VSIEGITEHDIASYLAQTPGFFERHAELLASIQLTSPHGLRAVSLQERQMEMLRERIKGLERRVMDMLRHGQENVVIADRLHRWTCAALRAHDPATLPAILLGTLQREFMIPHAALRLWGVAADYAELPCARPVSEDAQVFTASLTQPYCGLNSGFEAAGWIDAAESPVMSLALIPLRLGEAPRAFGLLVLGSPDPARYSADMGTDFLARVGEIGSAALARLLAR